MLNEKKNVEKKRCLLTSNHFFSRLLFVSASFDVCVCVNTNVVFVPITSFILKQIVAVWWCCFLLSINHSICFTLAPSSIYIYLRYSNWFSFARFICSFICSQNLNAKLRNNYFINPQWSQNSQFQNRKIIFLFHSRCTENSKRNIRIVDTE